jgi:hypothetical protein
VDLPLIVLRSLGLLALLWFAVPVAAHLMPEQRGTINLVGDGAYLVLSVPVSAFVAVDDDDDGKLSPIEFRRHFSAIQAGVNAGLQLTDVQGPRPIEGVLLSLANLDDAADKPSTHLVVMARFALNPAQEDVVLGVRLFGRFAGEDRFFLTARRGDRSSALILSKQRPEAGLLPAPQAVFLSFFRSGIEHISSGFDHLLFLLVVLAGGWGLRPLMLILSVFTLGHAMSLFAFFALEIVAPVQVVEPLIALTILGTAGLECRRMMIPACGFGPRPLLAYLTIILICAMIHGMGFARGLADLGLDPQHLWVSLTGFNLGIEFGQLFVALTLSGCFWSMGQLGTARLLWQARFLTVQIGMVGAVFFLLSNWL